MFLTVVGGLSTWIMQLAHETGCPFLICALAGMVAAMLAQMLLAWGAAPLLGSIECMVPSMIVGMVSPMLVCGLHIVGCDVGYAVAGALGAAFGLLVFVLLECYAARCRRALSQAGELTRG
ncbi:MAG: hypothetical protein IT450_01515 [Phycisphaerales bacterium]|nr:hypothetical protein [Phycisphaerales bacterium]